MQRLTHHGLIVLAAAVVWISTTVAHAQGVALLPKSEEQHRLDLAEYYLIKRQPTEALGILAPRWPDLRTEFDGVDTPTEKLERHIEPALHYAAIGTIRTEGKIRYGMPMTKASGEDATTNLKWALNVLMRLEAVHRKTLLSVQRRHAIGEAFVALGEFERAAKFLMPDKLRSSHDSATVEAAAKLMRHSKDERAAAKLDELREQCIKREDSKLKPSSVLTQ